MALLGKALAMEDDEEQGSLMKGVPEGHKEAKAQRAAFFSFKAGHRSIVALRKKQEFAKPYSVSVTSASVTSASATDHQPPASWAAGPSDGEAPAVELRQSMEATDEASTRNELKILFTLI